MPVKTFELGRVLSYRVDIEKIRKQEFSVAQHELDVAVAELKREEELLDLLEREHHRCQKDIGCIDDLKMYLDFFARKRDVIRELQQQILELEQVVNEKKEDLLEASKDKKMLQSLKEKRDEVFRQDTATRERVFLDEISVQKKG